MKNQKNYQGNNNLIIRVIEKNDYSELSKLYTMIHNYHNNLNPEVYNNVDNALDYEYFTAVVERDGCYVAIVDDRIVGCIISVIKENDNPNVNITKRLLIEALGVLEEYQRQGIAKRLLDECKKYAKEYQCQRIELNVEYNNEKAKAFYKKQNMKERMIRMEMKL